MATRFAVQTVIDAPAEEVWTLLTDAARYPEWNDSVVSISGRIAEREKIKLVAAVDPKRAFSLKVVDVKPERGMVWRGGMPLGLFTGIRTFSLREPDGAGTEFSMEETYEGPLAGLITRSIPDLTPSFQQFAACLKAAAERGA